MLRETSLTLFEEGSIRTNTYTHTLITGKGPLKYNEGLFNTYLRTLPLPSFHLPLLTYYLLTLFFLMYHLSHYIRKKIKILVMLCIYFKVSVVYVRSTSKRCLMVTELVK